MNNITLMGRTTREVELKYTQGGKAFARFNLAVPREFNRDEADFISCVAWDKRAETIAEYLRKGKRILVRGRIQTGSYEDKNGNTVYTTDVVVDSFNIIDFSDNNGSDGNSKNNSYHSNDDEIMDDEDFPF